MLQLQQQQLLLQQLLLLPLTTEAGAMAEVIAVAVAGAHVR